MSTFPTKLTAGDDLIPSFLVHDARFARAKPLSKIINLSISASAFPGLWKRTKIVPIHKKGNAAELQNYRSIAILSNFSKVFEKVIFYCVFSNCRSFIPTLQHGFLPGRSTCTNLAVITQFISEHLDRREQ